MLIYENIYPQLKRVLLRLPSVFEKDSSDNDPRVENDKNYEGE